MAKDERTDPQYKLRYSPELKAKIEAAAKESGRSINAEIVQRLEASFRLDQVLQADVLPGDKTATMPAYSNLLGEMRTMLDTFKEAIDRSKQTGEPAMVFKFVEEKPER
jgi:hypothetical protein